MRHLKEEFDKLTIKEVLVYALAVMTMAAGVTMMFLGLYIPPEGEIHDSVLTAFGIICIFSASLLGISIHYDNELTAFKRKVAQDLSRAGEERQQP